MHKGRVHPTHPLAPMGVSVAVLGMWWLVAHNGGSGWVQALGDVVFGALFIGILGPCLVLLRARIEVVAAPADATAGLPVQLTVRSTTRLRVRPLVPEGPEAFVGPARTGEGTELTLIPSRRGVWHNLEVDVATAAPFGLQWWSRRVILDLPECLHVAPRRGTPVALPSRSSDDRGLSPRLVPSNLGEPRGVRPYRPGDARRHVHWPATAHAGEMMVRELEEAAAEPTVVTVHLPADDTAAERLAERAMGTVLSLHDRGSRVILATTENGATVTGPVDDRRSAGRRLARATAEPAAAGIEVRR